MSHARVNSDNYRHGMFVYSRAFRTLLPLRYVIGGQRDNYCSQDGFSNDVFALDTHNWSWTRVFPSGTPPTRRYGHTAWSTPFAPDEGGFQITGGTCGTACGACGHANDTFVLQVCDDVFVVDCRRLLVAVGSICSSQRYCLYSCNPNGMEVHCTHSPRTFTRSVYQ